MFQRISIKHSKKPNSGYRDEDEAPFTYKTIKLKSTIPNHEFELIDEYDPNFKGYTFEYGKSQDPYDENRFSRFILRETINNDVYCIDKFIPSKSNTKVLYLNIESVKQKLAILLKEGCIG